MSKLLDFEAAWAKRNLDVENKLNKIAKFLSQKENAERYDATLFDDLSAQWTEFAKLTNKQIKTLDEILERVVDNEPSN